MESSEPASPLRAATQQSESACCQTAASRVQKMVLLKPASPPRAAALRPAGAGCRTVARRLGAEYRRCCCRSRRTLLRAAARQPAGAGCGTAARRVQKMVSSKLASPPRAPQPSNRPEPAAGLLPAEYTIWFRRSRVAARRVPTIVLSKPAPRAPPPSA